MAHTNDDDEIYNKIADQKTLGQPNL